MLHTIISGIDSLSVQTEQLLKEHATLEYATIKTEKELQKALQSCDIFMFRLNHKITSESLENATCKFILCAVTGLDHIDLSACSKKNIQVISLKGEVDFLKEVRATAEHTIGLLLALIRNSKKAFEHVENKQWNRYLFQGTELYKKKVGIYGMGRLGEIVAGYYKAFGMEIYYYDISNKSVSDDYIKLNSAEALFETVDIVSIHLPYQENTHFVINEQLLNRLDENAYLVNTSRGGVINEGDLLAALKHHKIAGYATDVLYEEPEIADNKLVAYAKDNDNVIITPHISGFTYESIEKTELFLIHKLKKTLNG